MDPSLFLTEVLDNESTESVGFLNDMVEHLWPYINVAVSKMIVDIVEPILADILPGPFKQTKFIKCDLGSDAMKFDRIDVLSKTREAVNLHVDVSWNGNCRIDLQSPLIGSFGVKKMNLTGRLAVVLKPLLRDMPVVSSFQLGFINPPALGLDFTGTADFADISIVKRSIYEIINKVLANVMVLPHRLLVPISPGNDFFATYIIPLGVIRLKLESGTGFETTGSLLKDVPDVYLKCALGGEEKVKTKTQKNNNDPEWNETFDFLYADKEQCIHIHAFDSDLNKDDDLGGIIFPVQHFLESDDKRVQVPLKIDGQETGALVTVSAELLPFSMNKSNFSQTREVTFPNQIYGLLTILVANADNIPDHPDLAPYCKIKIGDEIEKQTAVVTKAPGIDPRTPSFNFMENVPLTFEDFEKRLDTEFELFTGDHSMGGGIIHFDDVLEAHEMKYRTDFELEHGAVLSVCVQLSSLGD